MVVNRAAATTAHAVFADLPDLLPPGALLVANDTKVAPVRLLGQKPTGGAAEFLLLTPVALLAPATDPATGLVERCGCGAPSRLAPAPAGGTASTSRRTCTSRPPTGARSATTDVVLSWRGSLAAVLARIGHVPLPPYIRRADDAADREAYQTVYARDDKLGSAAAPTAGLHFTRELLARLEGRGFGFATVTCHVGHRHVFAGARARPAPPHHAQGVDRDSGADRRRRGPGPARGPAGHRRRHHRRPHPGRGGPRDRRTAALCRGNRHLHPARPPFFPSSTAWSRISICLDPPW